LCVRCDIENDVDFLVRGVLKEPWMADGTPDIRSSQAAGAASSAAGANAGRGGDAGAGGVADVLQQAAKSAKEIAAEAVSAGSGPGAQPHAADMPDFSGSGAKNGHGAFDLNLLDDVALRVKVELGRTHMYVEDVLRLNTASVVELDKAAGDPVDIYVNDRHVARGEVLVLNENFCVRVSEIIQQAGTDKPA
jgi:flagellar motor switch protein FliN/FliY